MTENALPRTVSLREQMLTMLRHEGYISLDWTPHNETNPSIPFDHQNAWPLGNAIFDLIDAQEAAEKKRLAEGYLNIQARIQGEIDRIEAGLATERSRGQNYFLATQLRLIIRQFKVVNAELNQPTQEGADSSDKGTTSK